MKAQRLRLTFCRGDEAREMSHLETMRALEGAVRGAGLPLAYSQSKRPTAQISIAVPLSVGATSECELADVYLTDRVKPQRFLAALKPALPPGLQPLSACEVGTQTPALQTRVRWAEYDVEVPQGARSTEEVRRSIDDLLSRASLPWEHRRENKVVRYDLRPLVLDVTLEAKGDDTYRLRMVLRVSQERSGRPDQVAAALGLEPPRRVHRRRLHVDQTPAVLQVFRQLEQAAD